MSVFTAFVLTALAFAPDDKPAAPKAGGDRAKLQGSWSGKVASQAVDIQMDIDGDKVTLTAKPNSDATQKFVIKGDYKIDESAKPKAWDFLNGKADGDRAMPDAKAIYELDGDTLKLCNANPGKERPTEFPDASTLSPQMIVFSRIKKDAVRPAK